MINAVPYLLFAVLFSVEYLAIRLQLIPRQLILLPELLSLGVALYVVVTLALYRRIALAGKYWVLFAVFGAHIVAGIVINAVEPGTVVAALRTYLKFLPFFLLPAVFRFAPARMRGQLVFLLVLGVLQLPVTLYQRFVQFAGVPTGDVIHGTLTISSVLSMVLIGAIAIVVAFYARKRLRPWTAALLALLLFLPTTINETKGTLILLPIALLLPAVFAVAGRQRLRRLVPIALFGTLALGLFVGVYDTLMKPRFGYGVLDFVSDPRLVSDYLFGGAGAGRINTPEGAAAAVVGNRLAVEARVSRGDSVVLPFRVLGKDPVLLLSGLGIGNASESIIGDFSGRYAAFVELGANKTAFAQLVWEVGLVGLALALLFLVFLFDDARRLARAEGFAATFAVGWTAVVAMMALALLYKNVLIFNVLGYLFWYFSGYVAAERFRQRLGVVPAPSP